MDSIVHGVAKGWTRLSNLHFQVERKASQVVKNPSVNSRDARDSGLIPGSRRSPVKEMAPHSSILAGGIPWTEEPGG